MNPSGEQCYSGGLDSLIAVWNIPNGDVDPYDPYGLFIRSNEKKKTIVNDHWCIDSSVFAKSLDGHTDAVWQLVICGQKLLSSSADGTVRLWDPNLSQPLQSTYQSKSWTSNIGWSIDFLLDEGIPISVDWINQDTNQFVVTYDNFKTIIYDTETSKILRQIPIDPSIQVDSTYRINRVLSHPTQPIVITAHDDRHIRYFDSHTGKQAYHSLLIDIFFFFVSRSNDSFHGRTFGYGDMFSDRSSTNNTSLGQSRSIDSFVEHRNEKLSARINGTSEERWRSHSWFNLSSQQTLHGQCRSGFHRENLCVNRTILYETSSSFSCK